ncbi:hypothetical protein BJ138DRAFT_1143267 [Hygrophoropsis aurantiaca]|uniref:Uncharacterized protein n=1 Tax=Hygrophoropsis aurantiaca TaxID=72124 RepID=A0ACB8AMU6_9AGAM|nr:hypothetical protein BJ138DRAFT_1143267 [Hygrophoropsis aurantiaca]
MAWGVFFRPSQQSNWEEDSDSDAPPMVHNDHSLGFIRQYNMPGTSSQSAMLSNYPSHIAQRELRRPDPQSLNTFMSPQFRRPLSMSVLNDPAFSPDPLVHPHFPLTDIASFKQVPSKSPAIAVRHLTDPSPSAPFNNIPNHDDMYPLNTEPVADSYHHSSEDDHQSAPSSEFSEFETPTTLSPFTSPSVSSSSSHIHSPLHLQKDRVPSPIPPPSLPLSTPSVSNRLSQKNGGGVTPESDRPVMFRNESAPESRGRPQHPVPTRAKSTPTHADGSNRPSGKRRVKNFVRRIANLNSLDRIDELDETDPFGGNWHHGGPYEAIGSNLAELGPAHKYNDIDVLRGDLYNSKTEHNISHHASKQPKEKLAQRRTMPAQNNPGMHLNLEPGQILPHNPPHVEHPVLNRPSAEMMAPQPNLFRRKPLSSGSRPDHNRSQSLPHHPNLSPGDIHSTSYVPVHQPSTENSQMRSSDLSLPPKYEDLSPSVHHRRPLSVVAPTYQNHDPRNVSSSRRASAQTYSTTTSPDQVSSAERRTSTQIPKTPRHDSMRSLESSQTHSTTGTQSSSWSQNGQLPPRNHLLPKRLVMPALLQPHPPPPPQHQYPFSRHPPDSFAYIEIPLSPPQGREPPMMYAEGRKLLKKKTAVFPANVPLPLHVPPNQGGLVPMTKNPSKKVVEVEKTKEAVHRRRLSKRKTDS